MSRHLFCAVIAGAIVAFAITGNAHAGSPIQTQGVRFKSKGVSLAPRVVPLSEVLPFRAQRTYPRYYYVRQ